MWSIGYEHEPFSIGRLINIGAMFNDILKTHSFSNGPLKYVSNPF